MEDPELIATLIPSDEYNRTAKAFCHEHNKAPYLAPRDIEQGPALSSRDPTPASDELIGDHDEYDFAHRLVLRLDAKLKNPAKGFCFGTNSKICDILLGPRGQGISNVHFYITFGTFDGRKRLILKDVSTHGTAVAYNGQAGDEVRDHFTWILDLGNKVGKSEVEVCVGKLSFKVELASHETCAKEYDDIVTEFLDEKPTLGGLAIYTATEPASPSLNPKRPIYFRGQELGRGSFGAVDKVINISTGEIYARKSFFEPQWERNAKRRARQREEWLNRVHREIRIMKENQHENIVKVVDDREESPPFLVMQYFPFGNLQDQCSERVLSEHEAIDVLYQALNALQYLHARGVAHRDLKPENILVESRAPLSVKLADFGLANDKSYLETVCGTPLYAAPEVCRHSRYTTAVDLWSLGVIILGYVYGLPSTSLQTARQQREAWGLAWCRRVVEYADDLDSDALLDLLTAGMLQMIPDERFSADACLIYGHRTGLFGDHAVGLGSATPKPKPAVQGEKSDGAGSAIIQLGALSSMEDGISNRHDGSGIGRFPALHHTSESREPYTHRATTSPSDSHSHDSQLGGFETASIPSGHGGQSVDLPCSLETRSAFTGGSKRLRSPAVGSANVSSGRSQVKRRPREDRPVDISAEDIDEISSQCWGDDGESTPYGTSYNAVLTLVAKLWLGDNKSQEMEIDDRTDALIGELCEHLGRLEITRMRLARTDLSGQMVVATGSDCREIMLGSLTPSELMSSIPDLVMHLLHMVQSQSSQLPSTPIVHEDEPQADAMAHGDPSRTKTVDTIGSSTATSSVRTQGATYPSALLDDTNVSGCSIPRVTRRSAHVK